MADRRTPRRPGGRAAPPARRPRIPSVDMRRRPLDRSRRPLDRGGSRPPRDMDRRPPGRGARRGPAEDPRLLREIDRARIASMYRGTRGMSFSASVVSALFFGFVVVYLAWSAHAFFQPSIATEVVRMGEMEVGHLTPGVIIRHEEVFFAERDGRVETAIRDFERVRDGTLVEIGRAHV